MQLGHIYVGNARFVPEKIYIWNALQPALTAAPLLYKFIFWLITAIKQVHTFHIKSYFQLHIFGAINVCNVKISQSQSTGPVHQLTRDNHVIIIKFYRIAV